MAAGESETANQRMSQAIKDWLIKLDRYPG